MKMVVAGIIAVLLTGHVAFAQESAHADFSGSWQFDASTTTENAKAAKMVAGPIFGDSFVAEQTAAALTLKISAGPLRVAAVYALDGSVSKNLSPGGAPGAPDIEVTSRATWDGGRLVIASTSQSDTNAGPVVVDSVRIMWLDAEGRLVIQRTGTPMSLVPSSRSVYKKQ